MAVLHFAHGVHFAPQPQHHFFKAAADSPGVMAMITSSPASASDNVSANACLQTPAQLTRKPSQHPAVTATSRLHSECFILSDPARLQNKLLSPLSRLAVKRLGHHRQFHRFMACLSSAPASINFWDATACVAECACWVSLLWRKAKSRVSPQRLQGSLE